MTLHGFRWALTAVAVALMVLAYRFVGMTLNQAAWIETHIGYYLVVIALGWFSYSLWKTAKPGDLRGLLNRRDVRIDCAVLLLLGIFLHVHEPHVFRVFNDEPSHVIGSMMMHEDRIANMPAKVHRAFNGIVTIGNFPSFRLYLFQVLLSFIHDISGYRAQNVFVLNGILTAVLLGLTYCAGRLFGGRPGGILAALLLSSLPLLAQNVTSGGYDVLNMVLILTLLLCTYRYIVETSAQTLELMISAGVLLALSRYESIVYLVIPVGAALLMWRRNSSVVLTPWAVASPLLTLPSMAANYIMVHTDAFTLVDLRGTNEGFFDLKYFVPHLQHMIYYLFSWDNNGTDSPVLSAVGVIAMMGMVVSLLSRAVKKERPIFERELLLGAVALVTFGLYAMTLTNFWGMPTDVMATRFILPVHIIFALAGVWFFNDLWQKSGSMPWWISGVAALYVWQYTVPANSKHTCTNIMVGRTGISWFVDYARKHDNGRTLYVAQSDVPIAIYRLPAIQTSVLNASPLKAAQAIQAKLYDEILIFESVWMNPADSSLHINAGATMLNREISLELVAEEKFAPDQLARILRFKGIKQPDGTVLTPAKVTPVRKEFKSTEELTRYYFDLLP